MFKFLHKNNKCLEENVPRWFKDSSLYKEKVFLLEDKRALDLYKEYLLKAGHCPECDDFLFIDIYQCKQWSNPKNIEFYTVIKRCINHECGYKVDISEDFNKDLGINIHSPKNSNIKEVPKQDYAFYAHQIEQGRGVPSHTGYLNTSWERNAFGVRQGFDDTKHFNRQMFKVVDKLPKPSQDTMNCLYVKVNDDSTYNVYITRYEHEVIPFHYWEVIDTGDMDELQITHKFNIETREDEFTLDFEESVCK